MCTDLFILLRLLVFQIVELLLFSHLPGCLLVEELGETLLGHSAFNAVLRHLRVGPESRSEVLWVSLDLYLLLHFTDNLTLEIPLVEDLLVPLVDR